MPSPAPQGIPASRQVAGIARGSPTRPHAGEGAGEGPAHSSTAGAPPQTPLTLTLSPRWGARGSDSGPLSRTAGEGWGEGLRGSSMDPRPVWSGEAGPPHPGPLPRRRGRGDQRRVSGPLSRTAGEGWGEGLGAPRCLRAMCGGRARPDPLTLSPADGGEGIGGREPGDRTACRRLPAVNRCGPRARGCGRDERCH